jgi:hypothetical protein
MINDIIQVPKELYTGKRFVCVQFRLVPIYGGGGRILK